MGDKCVGFRTLFFGWKELLGSRLLFCRCADVYNQLAVGEDWLQKAVV